MRELERAVEQGGVEAQARLLWEGVRRGRVDLERLRLAAHVGHAAARVALGAQAPAPPADLRACVRGLEAWGQEALVRAALAAAGRVLHLFGADGAAAEGEGAADDVLRAWSREGVELVAAWLAADAAARGEHARALAARGVMALRFPERDARQEALRALQAAGDMVTSRARSRPARDAVESAARALDLEQRVDDPRGETALALRDGLAPWALGERDPASAFAAPADPALWRSPPAPPPLPRLLERIWQGDFRLERLDGSRWLVLEQRGQRYRVAPFTPRVGERARCFACSRSARVVAWARLTSEGARVEVRRFDQGVFQEWSLAGQGDVVDVAVSPQGERLAWVSTLEGAPDAVWHLDLRLPAAEPARLAHEHEAVRSLHFATHCAIGFVTDRAAWEACPPEERKGPLLERLGVRLTLLTAAPS